MPEQTLKIIIDFFAYLLSLKKEDDVIIAKSFMEIFLSQFISVDTMQENIEYFETEYKKNKDRNAKNNFQQPPQIIHQFCVEINKEITIYQKVILLLYLFKTEKIFESEPLTDELLAVFNIPQSDINNYYAFFEDRIPDISDKKKILILSSNKSSGKSGIKYLCNPELNGQIIIMKAVGIDAYMLKVTGDDDLQISGRHLFSKLIYFLPRGASIRNNKIKPIHFGDIDKQFISSIDEKSIFFEIDNLEYKFSNNKIGIHKFSFTATSGQLVAIMGGSGTGKSTLLNILNGNLKPSSGFVYINKLNLHENVENLKGILGNIPQTDVLFEELTVNQNLYYGSKLVFPNLSKIDLEKKITGSLKDFGLYESRALKVGNSLNKSISGGQMKRLNIALEIIREPKVLFIDEPTSGLSSSDSLKIIQFLKKQTQHERLIFVNIHQPSSDIFKYFDSLIVLDAGGYPIYTGAPVDALQFFRNNLNLIHSKNSECNLCGTINTEEIFYHIEKMQLDSSGAESEQRVNNPEHWYALFKNQIDNKPHTKDSSSIGFKIQKNILPSWAKQFKIYFLRQIILKFTDKQYVAISLAEAPLLALALGFFMKQTDIITHSYTFSKNENIPSYLFMSVIVALFIGLIVSSEEIIRDRKILQRESYIGLSYKSYVHSKIAYLFLLSFIQMLLFVLIGNFILEIKGMNLYYLAVLWSVSCFANILGLLISANLKSVIAIYISIPFLLIPQILLAGVVVNFNKLHYTLASQKYVPVFADLMVSRWAYEALAVGQFKNNKYQKLLKNFDHEISDNVYQTNILIPKLLDINESSLNILNNKNGDHSRLSENLIVLQNEMKQYSSFFTVMNFNCFDSVQSSLVTTKILIKASNFLEKMRAVYANNNEKKNQLKETYLKNITDKNERQFLLKLKNNYFNEKLNDLVLDNNEFVKCLLLNNEIIRKYRPIYFYPENLFGRSHFYAPMKRISGFYIDSLWFNVGVIWIFTCLFYLILLTDLFIKLKNKIEKFNRCLYKIHIKNIKIN